MQPLSISIIIPVFNEEHSIEEVYQKISQSMKNCRQIHSHEIIFVDDGSTDRSKNKLNHLNCKKFFHSKNLGKSKALQTGIKNSIYPNIITIDSDLQNDPCDIPKFVMKFSEGYDFVCGLRSKRKDPFLKNATSFFGNWARKIILNDMYHDSACGFKIFKKECFFAINYFEGNHRFLPYLFSQKGFNGSELLIKHNKRKYGKSKYGICNRMQTIVDLYKVKTRYKKNEFI